MSKRKIVIATHGTLAEGFKSALQIIAGAENVEAFNCYTSPDFNLQETIQKVMDSKGSEEELFVFTDLFGGSVNNGFVAALKTYDFHLITNTSLGLLIDFILMEPDVETLKKKFDEKEFNAVYCNDFTSNMTDIEDDL